ncbi:MAG TPA: FtsX-like permease family protein [Verrucomicrobiae bacterium]
MKFLLALFSSWTWRMAWRDSRASRRKLLLFSSSIVIGIAALVAISSFGQNLRWTIDQQAKSLLGADLVLAARDPFTPEMEQIFAEIGGEQAREVIFSSMAYFPKSEGTRLVQIRALERGFPFYGDFQTSPAAASTNFHKGGALVEQTLLFQYNSQPGDPVKVGELTLEIAGSLEKVPGENAVFSTIAPRIYLPYDKLDATQLVRDDSFARFKVFFKLPESVDVEKLVRRYRPKFDKLRLGADTVEERKEQLGRNLENLNRFLGLGGFIALLLGAIGIASAIHVHVKQKTSSVAVLRCLGCSVPQTFAIYLAQAIAIGLLGALIGSAIGLGIQFTLPRVVADFLPFPVELKIAWIPVLRALAAGFAVCLIFALLPLMSVRRISPLAVLRAFYEPASPWRDVGQWIVIGVASIGLIFLARAQAGRWDHAFGFVGALAAAFLLLTIFAQLLRTLMRRIISPAWPFAWRQGMANLHRPHNRTLLLLLSLGLGVFLVLTLYRTNQIIAGGLIPKNRGSQPNAALFDIQSDQVASVTNILREKNLPIIDEVPLVTMRLAYLKGEPVRRLMRESDRNLPRWALRREYRSTYRDTLDSSEQLIKGAWPVKVTDPNLIPISIEEGIAQDLKVDLGDELVFDVQGVLMTNRVASIRRVDWKRIQPNFFVVFPSGVLEEAPGFHIITTHVNSREQSADMQRAIVRAHPNVSVIDLTLVLDTLDAILSKIAFVVRFMALFTVITGLVVLVAAVLTGRYQRIQETILLRTLGASRQQVHRILLAEYLLLGLLSALTGIVLAEAGAWLLARYVFEAEFQFAVVPMLIALAVASLATVFTGLVANRGVLDSPPLEILRSAA